MVLVTGPTGSGKSTTLAALIDLANRTRRDHIMTVEDPIEFLHRHKQCLVNQREVGEDTHSFASALKHVLRQDPDIILVGEMRDLETISVALTAAETGHLVFATLHTQDAAQTIDRVIDVFPAEQQDQVRTQLAGAIQGVVCQTLCKTADGKGRVVATEVLVATAARPQPDPRRQDAPDLLRDAGRRRSTACTPSTSTWPSWCAPTRSPTSTAWRSATTSRTSTACSAGSEERHHADASTFEYAVRDRSGKLVKGTLDADNQAQVVAEAAHHGLRAGEHHRGQRRHEQGARRSPASAAGSSSRTWRSCRGSSPR